MSTLISMLALLTLRHQALLLEISTVGHGMFSYIPDASMIGDPHSHLNLPALK
jgi:hypothetical protein